MSSIEIPGPGFYGILVSVFLFTLTIFVLFSTGSFVAVLVLWALIALVLVVLVYYGFLDIEAIVDDLLPEEKKKPEAPVVAAKAPTSSVPMQGSEVFHVSDNQFTYDEAPAVCAAYGAELATLEQIIEAYNGGAEWCNYGWSAGGMALYPTQKTTWTELQREIDPGKRTRCGRPGVNGGYFDPALKFGVNCFGFKPEGAFTPPAPVPGTDMESFRSMVNKFKEMIKTMNLSPFSRREWSGYDATATGKIASYGKQFKQDIGKLTEGFESADPKFREAEVTGTAAYTAAPYGLKGAPGDTGPPGTPGIAGERGAPGPVGPQGPQGQPGRGERGLPGDPGPAGPKGEQGIQGVKGDKGDKGDQGERGLQGVPGAAGSSVGVVGPKGDKGDRGEAGPKGDKGDQGPAGVGGSVGPMGPAGAAGPAGPPGPPSDRDSISDTRDTTLTPDQYWKTKGMGVWREFKKSTVAGIPPLIARMTEYSYGYLETVVPWHDASGGAIQQTFSSGGASWRRASISGTAWSPWVGV